MTLAALALLVLTGCQPTMKECADSCAQGQGRMNVFIHGVCVCKGDQ